MISDLLGFVKTCHEAFCLATTTIHQINDKLDNDLQTVVVEEKSTSDSLNSTQQNLVKLEEKIKVLQDQCGELEEQLSKLDENLEKEKESLHIATAVHHAAISSAREAVDEASDQVTRTQRRYATKETELRKLKDEQDEQEKVQRSRCEELELLKAKKEQVKKSQESLAKLNYSIKSCTTFVDTTASRAQMMADEAHGKLPDIEAMVLPLKAIAGDIAEASLCDTRLLSGRVDMKGIGAKIKAITSKAEKSVTCSEVDQWV